MQRRKYVAILRTFLVIIAALCGTGTVTADDCVKPEWKIDSVQLPRHPQRSVDSYVELGDIIAITSPNLPDLRKCAKPNNPLLVYLDGMPLKGLLEFPPSDPAGHEALYTLAIRSDNRPIWNKLLGSPNIGATRPVSISIGLADGYALPSQAKVALRAIPPIWFAVWVFLLSLSLIVFFWLAWKSNLLRGGTPAGGRVFSISRSQAAWWFYLILASYILIGLTTGDYTTSLNSTALILLGIASATYLGSAAVDASKNTQAELDAQNAERERLRALVKRTPAEQAKLDLLEGKSQGWLKDILSDSEGVDFHRFQMLVWTIVLGIIFVVRVWQDLAMPEFDATLLGLMGLSAGTYIGLKIPEKTK